MIGSAELYVLLLSTLVLFLMFLKYHFSYWKRKNIPHIEPNYVCGNMKDFIMLKKTAAYQLDDLYNHKNTKGEPYFGIYMFHKPGVIVKDLEIVKKLLIKDFNIFPDRYARMNPHKDLLGSYNLFLIKNPLWKELRQKLTPVFTSGKMKQMFHHVNQIGNKLNEKLLSLELEKQRNNEAWEMKELCALFTTDVIASVAYGLEANSLKNPDGDFRRNGRKLFEVSLKRAIDFTSMFFIPQLIRVVNAKVFTDEQAHFLTSTIVRIMDEREKSGVPRNDLIDTLLSFKKQNYPQEMIVAQASIFFTAGFETTSSVMSFALYELSKNQKVQQKLRDEIQKTLSENNGEITYEMINSMEYLRAVVQEVLRMYPPLPFLDRECKLENGQKIYKLDDKLEIPDKMPVFIPIYSIQRDPKYFTEPNKFIPERFSKDNVDQNIHANMPFGIGPHNCIGERFGLMQARIGIVSFLRNHYVIANEKTAKEMVLDPLAVIISAKDGIYCDIVRDPMA